MPQQDAASKCAGDAGRGTRANLQLFQLSLAQRIQSVKVLHFPPLNVIALRARG
jgi:hypothetical protein